MDNKRVKFCLKVLSRFGKLSENLRRVKFLAHPVYHSQGGATELLLCDPDGEFGICILT